MGQAASVETLHMPVSLCLGRKRRRLGQRKERNREMVEQQTDRQTSPGRDGSPAQRWVRTDWRKGMRWVLDKRRLLLADFPGKSPGPI